MKHSSRTPTLLPAIAALTLVACAVNPVSHKREVTFTTTAEEIAIGADQARKVDEFMGLAGSDAQRAYVEKIGERLAALSPRKDVPYTFKIVDMKEPNAFALPGGPVYVSRGLLALANSEDEVACVIGHEIGHIAARHHSRQQTRQAIASPFTAVTGLTGAITGIVAPRIGAAISGAGAMAAGGILASYSREQERESDRIGIRLAADNGWDPEAMSRFLHTLSAEEVLQAGKARDASFLDSHPATNERVDNTASEAATLERTDEPPIAKNQAAFFAELDGLVVGDDPGDGVFLDGRFVHPRLEVSIKFPESWESQKSHLFVAAADPKGKGLVMVTSPGEGDDPLRGAAAINRKMGFNLSDVKTGKIADLPAARYVAQTRSRGGPVAVDFTWFAYRGRIYQVIGAMPGPLYIEAENTFLDIAKSFRPMTEAERNQIIERRLRIAKARKGETLRTLLERTNAAVSPAQAAVMNDMEMDTPLRSGQLVKIIEEQVFTNSGR
jgi:predicted Zn-dependent protease